MTKNAIISFEGPYRFLSNFHIEPDGTNVEAEFQQAKCVRADDFAKFTPTMSPGAAKRLGRTVELVGNWNHIKIGAMYRLVLAKFQEPSLRAQLLATGDAKLIEGNTWGDTFWGKDILTMLGKNHLGNILMRVREKLK